jgi:proline iminopeptidase
MKAKPPSPLLSGRILSPAGSRRSGSSVLPLPAPPGPAHAPALVNADGTPRRGLYPACEANYTSYLRVSATHELYFEESGNPSGVPVIFLHGGPGSGTEPNQRRFFDPSYYRIILFDQRGAGRSRPHAALTENTTWHLVADLEQLREHLGIERWLVFGGSWGSTLALAYAERFPERVTGLVLRGIFLFTQRELDWFYQDGACQLFPDSWEDFIRDIPLAERGELLPAYQRRLDSPDPRVQLAAARAWSLWEARTSRLYEDPTTVAHYIDDQFALAFARIENHYFLNRGFLAREHQLIEEVGRIRHIPAVIVQGRYDIVCPMEAAWSLHRAWPEAELRIVPDAGHSATEPGVIHELILATDRMRELLPGGRRRSRQSRPAVTRPSPTRPDGADEISDISP